MSREHLDHSAVIQAVVDGENASQKQHLDLCDACRQQVDELRSGLAELGRRSRQTAPRPGKAFAWRDDIQSAQAQPWKWLWSPAAGAMAAALLLAVAWLGFRLDSPSPMPLGFTETITLSEMMDAEPERLGGFIGFMVAENSSGQEQLFLNAGDDDIGTGAEGVILWPGEL